VAAPRHAFALNSDCIIPAQFALSPSSHAASRTMRKLIFFILGADRLQSAGRAVNPSAARLTSEFELSC
jgi:hypothetical protein